MADSLFNTTRVNLATNNSLLDENNNSLYDSSSLFNNISLYANKSNTIFNEELFNLTDLIDNTVAKVSRSDDLFNETNSYTNESTILFNNSGWFNNNSSNETSHFGFLDNLAIFINSECIQSIAQAALTPVTAAGNSTADLSNEERESAILVVLPQDVLFYLANVCFLAAYLSPNTRYGQVFLHAGLVVGFLIFSAWAWNIACAPDVFAWYFGFMLLNVGQLLYILYQMRPIQFDPDLENAYQLLFFPMGVTRIQFKRLLGGVTGETDSRPHHFTGDGSSSAQIITLHSGECYAIQNMTKTDRLALLLSGRVNVINDRSFLHHIEPGEFLDSPEFESSGPNSGGGIPSGGYNFGGASPPVGDDTTFNVTVCAAVQSRCVVWRRSNLEYQFVKDPQLATAMTTLISRDITLKLYAMNVKLRRSVDGANLDIRLPGIAGRLCEMDARQLSKFNKVQKDLTEVAAGQTTKTRQKRSGKRETKTLEFAPPLLIPIQKKKKKGK